MTTLPLARTHAGTPASTVPKLGAYRRNKVRKLREIRGIPHMVPSGRPHAHTEWLLDLGFTYHSIAAAAEVGVTTVRQIHQQRFHTTHIEIASRILAVTHKPTQAQAGFSVPALGAVRRIHALQALAWTQKDIGARLHVTASAVGAVTRRHSITFEVWDAVRSVFEQLSGSPGESGLTRSRALARGFHPPLAWEGLDIDHPDHEPTADTDLDDDADIDPVLLRRILDGQHRGKVPKPERAAVLDLAVGKGWSGTDIVPLLNLTQAAADQALVRRRRELRKQAAV
ncbi:hypothetical protein [Nocardia sp. CC227C]|uniref:hypothetical protein n=1 Tax=Nocardia sp. CC227C TaxID=3044562 RepID=UPI00278C7D74|nr:hypothetical protein [Nocardia sp. CC227C]